MRVWVFADFKPPTLTDIKFLVGLGVTDVVLGISTAGSSFTMPFSVQRWLTAAERCHEHGLRPHFMVWLVRRQAVLDQMVATVLPMVAQAQVLSLMFDAEAHFHQGTITVEQAVDFLLKNHPGCDIGVTGLDRLHPSVIPLARACDYVLPQAYSWWKPGSASHWSHSPWTFPGVQQRRAYNTWTSEFGNKPFVMGLSCYYGKRPKSGVFPGLTDIQAMRMCLAETRAIVREATGEMLLDENGNLVRYLGQTWFHGVAYWSLKHLKGTSAQARNRQYFVEWLSQAA